MQRHAIARHEVQAAALKRKNKQFVVNHFDMPHRMPCRSAVLHRVSSFRPSGAEVLFLKEMEAELMQ